MHQSASRHDFYQLSDEQQDKHEAVLRTLEAQRLPCRCEMVGKDFQIVIAPGLSAAKFWLDKFELNGQKT